MRKTGQRTAGLAALLLIGTSSITWAADAQLNVAYRDQSFTTAVMTQAEKDFEASHPGVDVVLNGINASASDYYTKLSLMNQSDATAADVMYLDGFYVTADASAGYLAPLNDMLSGWADWSQFSDTIRKNGTSLIDGNIYAIPMGTDTQAIWYNKALFKQAGLPEDWQPKSWQEVLDTAATLKEKLPDVAALNLYVTKAQGEAATLRGLQNLAAGTPGGLEATLFDTKDQKWITGSKGFTDSLTFIKTAYDAGYLPSNSNLQDSNLGNILVEQMVPAGKIAMFVDGSWIWSRWEPKGNAPWDAWRTTLGQAKIPTQNGEEPGSSSMSGGWTLAMGAHAKDKQLAFDFMTTVTNKENALNYAMLSGSIAARTDVIADDRYLTANPTAAFFSDLLKVTHFRPAVEKYSQISNLIQETLEAITVGGSDVASAVQGYDGQLTRLVGSGSVEKAAQ